MKSHFNFAFAFDERSLQTLSVKNAQTFHSLSLYHIVVFFFSLSRSSQISFNAKIRRKRVKHVGSLCQRKNVAKRLFADYFS